MRFILDGMLGKLNRWLRMMGHETVYTTGTDSELLNLTKDCKSVLLTSDEQLYRRAISRGIESFLVRGTNESERLAALAHRFGIKLDIDPELSRCPKCGWAVRRASKQRVKSTVPSATFKVHQRFWKCTNPNCAKIYWQGSHWKKIEQTLTDARKILGLKRPSKSQ